MKYNLIAIDPGINGAIVYQSIKGQIIISKMPETPKDIYDLFESYKDKSYCFLEKVHGMPKMGGAAMFTFGEGYGYLQMALIANQIPFELVTPQRWMKTFSIGTKTSCSSISEWKNKLKKKAQELYPKENVTLWNADALLILNYAVRNIWYLENPL